MARLIDADAMRDDWLENGENEYVYDTNDVLDSIDSQPTVDAVEVVRCRNCKRCFKHTTKRNRQKMWICMRNDLDVCVRPDDFCSYGERKDNCRTRLEDVKK